MTNFKNKIKKFELTTKFNVKLDFKKMMILQNMFLRELVPQIILKNIKQNVSSKYMCKRLLGRKYRKQKSQKMSKKTNKLGSII